MTKIEKYLKSAERGEFHYEVVEDDPATYTVHVEECYYKEKCVGKISYFGDGFEVETDFLQNEPMYICAIKSSRKRAREFLEKVIKNDEVNNGNNMKYR